MTRNMKNISISGIILLIVFSSELLSAGQSDLPEPEMLRESYLQDSREERNQQCSKEVSSALGRECTFCHNEDVPHFTEKGDRSNIGEIFRINHDMNNYLRFLSINSGNRLLLITCLLLVGYANCCISINFQKRRPFLNYES